MTPQPLPHADSLIRGDHLTANVTRAAFELLKEGRLKISFFLLLRHVQSYPFRFRIARVLAAIHGESLALFPGKAPPASSEGDSHFKSCLFIFSAIIRAERF
jgi:hypothetical protein